MLFVRVFCRFVNKMFDRKNVSSDTCPVNARLDHPNTPRVELSPAGHSAWEAHVIPANSSPNLQVH